MKTPKNRNCLNTLKVDVIQNHPKWEITFPSRFFFDKKGEEFEEVWQNMKTRPSLKKKAKRNGRLILENPNKSGKSFIRNKWYSKQQMDEKEFGCTKYWSFLQTEQFEKVE